MQGEHQCLFVSIVQSVPRESNEPHLWHEGGVGVGMWLCFSSVFVRHRAHRGVGVGRSRHVLTLLAVHSAHLAMVGAWSCKAVR